MRTIAQLQRQIVACRRCPRLVQHCQRTAREKVKRYRDWDYWGKPVSSLGDRTARLYIVGRAPAAHGGNRTGRVFTGARSGDWVFGALYASGFANQPTSVRAGDGLALRDAYITAAVRCAPPANKPTPTERDACRPFLERELALLVNARVAVALGAFAYGVLCTIGGVRPRPRFGHGVIAEVPAGPGSAELLPLAGISRIICSFHPSQQNTFTGRLTADMADTVLRDARRLANLAPA